MSEIPPPPALSIFPPPPPDTREVRREQKRYLTVYAMLMIGTALTVTMHYVHFEAFWQTVAVALFIATAKAACVAAVFMHLWHGERDVYRLMFLTGVFAATMFALTIYSQFSLPGTGHYLR